MAWRFGLLFLILQAGAGCGAVAPPPQPGSPQFPNVSYLRAHDASRLDRCVLVSATGATTAPSGGTGAEVLPIRFDALWAYATRYGRGGNDCPAGSLGSDCAHFQAHCLAAAGVRVAYPSAACDVGMTIRVRDLAIAFDNASLRYANVGKIRDYRLARRGDWCFLPRESNLGNPHDHLMLLAAAPSEEGACVYSHTNNRDGGFVRFDAARCLYFRIEEGATGGNWP